MKEWNKPEIEVLNINATENGYKPSGESDGPWIQINGHWYSPGSGTHSEN